jgi:hypothetical protein
VKRDVDLTIAVDMKLRNGHMIAAHLHRRLDDTIAAHMQLVLREMTTSYWTKPPVGDTPDVRMKLVGLGRTTVAPLELPVGDTNGIHMKTDVEDLQMCLDMRTRFDAKRLGMSATWSWSRVDCPRQRRLWRAVSGTKDEGAVRLAFGGFENLQMCECE